MKKQAIFILSLITLFFASAYIMANYGFNPEQNNNKNMVEVSQENKTQNEIAISANAEDEKTTPNTKLILKKYYADCGHLITSSAEIPKEMVNLE